MNVGVARFHDENRIRKTISELPYLHGLCMRKGCFLADNRDVVGGLNADLSTISALEQFGDRIIEARRQFRSSGEQTQDNTPLARVRGLSRALDTASQNATASGGGSDEIRALLRATNRLERRLEMELGEALTLNTTLSRANYLPRGSRDENTQALIRMTKDKLDLIEARLLSRKSNPIRAQKTRDAARDSEQAARYFHDLSAQQQ